MNKIRRKSLQREIAFGIISNYFYALTTIFAHFLSFL